MLERFCFSFCSTSVRISFLSGHEVSKLTLGATAAATALRHKDRYCPSTASNAGDCRGVFRVSSASSVKTGTDVKGTMGLGWSLVGLNLIYLIYLAVFVPKHGNWSTEMHHIPPRVVGNAEMDKAPTH